MEPYRLREWRVTGGRLFTCGRPGRSKGKDIAKVSEKAINEWVRNLPSGEVVILSLLGRKPDGTSEFSFYPFCGGFDLLEENSLTFEAWLATHHPERKAIVLERPTIDFKPVPQETLNIVAEDINRLLKCGKTVVLMDSGGKTRTGAVCRFLNLQEKFG